MKFNISNMTVALAAAALGAASCTANYEDINRNPYEVMHKEAEKELTGHTYVVVSKNRTDEVREALHLLSGAQNQVLWVIPYLPGEEVPSEQNRAYTAIGWEVKPWK